MRGYVGVDLGKEGRGRRGVRAWSIPGERRARGRGLPRALRCRDARQQASRPETLLRIAVIILRMARARLSAAVSSDRHTRALGTWPH
jgi:hypothetical protein